MSASFRSALMIISALAVVFLPVDGAFAVQKSKEKVKQVATHGKAKSAAKAKTVVGKAKSKPAATQAASGKKASIKTASAKAASPRFAKAVKAPVVEQDPGRLNIQSGSALVFDQSAGDALFQKNANQIAPIASITKLMTAMVVLDSTPALGGSVTVTDEDVDYLRGSRSRLQVGSVLTRESALLLALMSSENRAAHALARHYPGGLPAFLAAMNVKAQALGMRDTHFEDPTGLTSNNVSTASDLVKMVAAAYRYPLIREFTTTAEATVEVNGREVAYRNTNPLVRNGSWDVGLSKTGYIQEAGKCLVMQARVADKPVVIVLLDSNGSMTRVGDANRIKRWMEHLQASRRLPTHANAGAGARSPG